MRIGIVSVSMAVAVWALAGSAAAESSDSITASVNQIRLSTGALNQNYREFNDGLTAALPAVLDSEAGDIPMLQFGAGMLRPRLYAEVHLSLSAGNTTYTGFLQAPGPSYTRYIGTTYNTIFSAYGRVGLPFRPTGKLVLVPYVEAGEHFWRRDLGFTEDYSHYWIGLGGKLLWSPRNRWVVEAGLGYGVTVLPNMTLDGHDFELGSKPWRNGMLAVDYHLTGRWHLRWSAEYRAWHYGQSPVVNIGGTNFVEPRSESVQATYLMSVAYNYTR